MPLDWDKLRIFHAVADVGRRRDQLAAPGGLHRHLPIEPTEGDENRGCTLAVDVDAVRIATDLTGRRRRQPQG